MQGLPQRIIPWCLAERVHIEAQTAREDDWLLQVQPTAELKLGVAVAATSSCLCQHLQACSSACKAAGSLIGNLSA